MCFRQKNAWARRLAGAGALAGLSTSLWAAQVSTTFTGATGGSWSTASGWSGGVVPNNNATTTFNVTIDGTAIDKSVQLNTNATIDNLTITAGDSLAFNSSFLLTIAGSTINNSGTIALNAAGFTTDLLVADISLGGGGTIVMSNNSANQIQGIASSNRLTNVDNTIKGSGNISGLRLTNQGTIVANQSTRLLIVPSGTQNFNTGLIQAAGGTLQFTGGVLINTAGTIEAANASLGSFSAITITGGVLQTSGTGRFETPNMSSATLSNLSLTGKYVGFSSSSTNLSGTITNTGTISIEPAGFITELFLIGSSPVVLTGGGRVELVGHDAAPQLTGTATLVSDNTIRGWGSIQNIGLVNSGTIASDIGSFMSIMSQGTFSNSGTILAANGGTIQILPSTSLSNTGTILADNGSTISIINTVQGGTLTTSGTGRIQTDSSGTATLVDLTNAGEYLVQNAAAVTLLGSISNTGTITSNGTSNSTSITIGGTSAVTLGGSGRVNLTPVSHINGTGTLVSNNTIRGRGVIDCAGLVNNGTIICDTGGVMSLLPTVVFMNTGTLSASGGGSLLIPQAITLNNTGTLLAQSGSTISLVGSFTISGGTLASLGSGVVQTGVNGTASLSNVTLSGNYAGRDFSNTLLTGTITNNGTFFMDGLTGGFVRLTGGTVTLAGGGTFILGGGGQGNLLGSGTLVSDNVIRGFGGIGANGINLTNNNLVTADIATASITIDTSTQLKNNATLRAENSGRLLIQFSTVSNTGTITALNGSTVTFGSTTNISGGTLTTAGSGVIETQAGQTVNMGNLRIAGLYICQSNSTTTINNASSNTGTIIVTPSALLSLLPASMNATGGTFVVNSGGTINSTTTATGGNYIIDGQLNINGGGTSSVGDISGTGTVALNVGTWQVQSLRVGTVSIASGKTLTVRADGTPTGTSRLANMPVLAGTAKLDLKDNDLVLDYSAGGPITAATIRSMLFGASGSGSWTGSGITSSSAGASPLIGNTALGYRDAVSMFGAGGGTFSGQTVDDTTMLIKYTYAGDATLDGVVDIKDLMALALHYNAVGTWAWDQGDFDYNGQVNVADLTTLARNWQVGVGTPLGSSLGASLASLGLPQVSVPEPAIGAFSLLTWSLRRPRRRINRARNGR